MTFDKVLASFLANEGKSFYRNGAFGHTIAAAKTAKHNVVLMTKDYAGECVTDVYKPDEDDLLADDWQEYH